ncbi:MAG: hypothetical protein HY074_12080 [Deltaproteobacteria bacterium]|nr:hypothetical protein [Deltaproteobacteria bacterium]
MAQGFKITVFFILFGTLVTPMPCFAEGEYIAAFSKAEAEYSRWMAENMRRGVKPTAEERREKHKLIFAEAHSAYLKENIEVEKDPALDKQFMGDMKNYNPPAKQGRLVDVDGTALKEVSKATPSRSVANVAERGAIGIKPAVALIGEIKPPTTEVKPADLKAPTEVKPGTAENVSFKGSETAVSFITPTPGAAVNVGTTSFVAPAVAAPANVAAPTPASVAEATAATAPAAPAAAAALQAVPADSAALAKP